MKKKKKNDSNELNEEQTQETLDENQVDNVSENKVDECEEWKQKYLYTLAELENFRKRVVKERSELIKYGSRDVFYDLLEITDNFGRVIEADKKESDPKVIVQGIEMIYNQLIKLLKKNEVKPIEAEKKEFDPNVHDAMQMVPTDEYKPGTVIQEIQKGYKYRDRILRPARVVVAAEPEGR
ncbi:MAG: nucleotide exchange factor GrpE [Chlamydiae bacterium]|nr:MAG: nucleotide exchange factor GrpE [Chlamydiota bacterium]